MQNSEINAPATGIIQRSNGKSFFLRFHQNSKLSDMLFNEAPKYKDRQISVMQVMLIGDGYILAECINLED